MKIVIDARVPNFGGIYSYTIGLLKALTEIAPEHEFVVIRDRRQGALDLGNAREWVISSDNPLFWLLWNQVGLPQLLKREKADVYHSVKQLSVFPSITKKIYTIHSAYPHIYPQYRSTEEKLYWTRMFSWTARHADAVISVAHSDAAALAPRLGVDPAKIAITQLAANPRFTRVTNTKELESARTELGLPAKYLVYVGTIYPVKNVPTILRVFKRLRDRGHHDLRLVLAGRFGWKADTVRQLVRELGIGDDVIFTGHQYKLLPHIYTMAELLLFPSYYEAFCAPPLEAMACGTPVVASDRGGIPEVVGDAALLRGPDDVDGLSDACEAVLQDAELRGELVQRGYRRAACFDWRSTAEATLAVYESVATGQPLPVSPHRGTRHGIPSDVDQRVAEILQRQGEPDREF